MLWWRVSSCFLAGFFLALSFWRCSQSARETSESQDKIKLERAEAIDPGRCASCHKEVVEKYLTTGKGRSFYKASTNRILENWNVSPVYDSATDLFYLPIRVDSLFFIKEFRQDGKDTIHSRTERISYFIGSGNQTRSYLLERNGYLFEHPITWYARKKIWDLSPGYEEGRNTRFDRKIGSECLYCHNSGFEAVPESENRYARFGSVIGCERCHGNLENHLTTGAKIAHGKPTLLDLKTIPLEAKLDLCRQCHLEGVKVRKADAKPGDFEPGKRLSDYYEVFIPQGKGSEFGFASHAERLQMSRCFVQSKGKMSCTSCHNPHESIPENAAEFFSQKCRSCHQTGHEKSCSGLKNMDIASANCPSCHMKSGGTNDIPHVNSTDHLIRKKLETGDVTQADRLVFRNFSGRRFSAQDMAQAKLQYAETHPESQAQLYPELIAFLDSFPNSPQEFRLKASFLTGKKIPAGLDTVRLLQNRNPFMLYYWSQLKKGENQPFLNTLAQAVSWAPDWIELRYVQAMEKEEAGLDARSDYEAILEKDSLHARALTNLGFHELNAQHFARAETLLHRAIKSDPDYRLARENLVRCLMGTGKFAEAKILLRQLIKQNPKELRYLSIMELIP